MDERQRLAGLAQAGDDRPRGPLHPARRGPGLACASSASITRGSPSRRIEVETDGASESKPLTAALAPAQIINVRVTYADTGKPVPHAPLEVMASRGRVGMLAEFETDAEGRFRVNSWPADRSYNVSAYPPEGQPYLIDSQAYRVAQGRARAVPRPRLTAGRLDPRQGHRGGLRQARRGGDRRL